ncbi:hypothetical protein DFAR_1670005 [Desulfarculales bacterium]
MATAALAEGIPDLDPSQHTAGQFISDVESKQSPESLGLAILWGYGYICGEDESFIPRFDEALIESLLFKYMVVCKGTPSSA